VEVGKGVGVLVGVGGIGVAVGVAVGKGVGVLVGVGGTGVLVGVGGTGVGVGGIGVEVGVLVGVGGTGVLVGMGVGAVSVYDPFMTDVRISLLSLNALTEALVKVIVAVPAERGVRVRV